MLIRAEDNKVYNLNDVRRLELEKKEQDSYDSTKDDLDRDAPPEPKTFLGWVVCAKGDDLGQYGVELTDPKTKEEAQKVLDLIMSKSGGVDLNPPKRSMAD